jgi:hypothetical protein
MLPQGVKFFLKTFRVVEVRSKGRNLDQRKKNKVYGRGLDIRPNFDHLGF